MSVRVMSWVMYDSPAVGNDRLVLLMVADEADDDGRNAFPSYETIAHKARVSRATAIRAVDRLEKAGELLVKRPVHRGRGRFNKYVVVMGRDPNALAGSVGWPAPTLDPTVAAEWETSQNDTLVTPPESGIGGSPQAGDKPGDDGPLSEKNGSERLHESPEKARPGATRPVDPMTPRASRALPGDRARADAANLASTQAAAVVLAAEGNAYIESLRDRSDALPPADLAAAARAAREALHAKAPESPPEELAS